MISDLSNIDIPVSINEANIPSVRIGQKATVTFDALPDLTLTGQVQRIDQQGTTTSGVVSYDVTIKLDVQDRQVKPGMSCTAEIMTAIAKDASRSPTAPSSRTRRAPTSRSLRRPRASRSAWTWWPDSPTTPGRRSSRASQEGQTVVTGTLGTGTTGGSTGTGTGGGGRGGGFGIFGGGPRGGG